MFPSGTAKKQSAEVDAKIISWQIGCLQANLADLILIGREPDNEETDVSEWHCEKGICDGKKGSTWKQ